MSTVNLGDAAERSTLGALLHTPDSVCDISRWLQPSDFHHPRNSIAFALIGELAAASCLGPMELLRAALARADARRNSLDGPFVHDLMRSPASVERAAMYGRLVLEASIRRQVIRHGLRLNQVARGSDIEGVAWPLAQVDRADEGLAGLSHRLLQAGLPHAEALSAGRQYRPSAPSDRCHRYETAALSALLARPSAVEDIGLWLRPGDFLTPEHAATYASMLALRDRCEPIEPLTIAWHGSHRRGGLTLSELTTLASRPLVGAAHAACRELLELRLEVDVARAASAMLLAGMRSDLSGSAVLAVSRSHLAELADPRDRLRAAHRQTTTRGRLPDQCCLPE